jgi:stage V sporulation protein R
VNENKSTALSPHLADIRKEVEGYAREYGLDFYETIFEVVGFDELNMVAAYGGFPNRYPHWRFGMDYEQLSKGYEYGLSKIYELVINNDPSYAYLMESNMDVDQKLVMAHVFGHVDFFKNNFSFRHTNRKMMDEMANHATRIRRIIDRVGIEPVEAFIDRALSLENLIDQHAPHFAKVPRRDPDALEKAIEVHGFKTDREYMNQFINPQEFLDEQRKKLEDERARSKKFPERPQRDVLLFLLEHAPLERWEADILAVMRDEAYYFAPQGQTKIINEGWACLAVDSMVYTDAGLIRMGELVAGVATVVSDGKTERAVYDKHVIRDHATVRLRTRRGLELCGSKNHRILLADGQTWKRLDAFATGDEIAVSGGANLWPRVEVPLSWRPRERMLLSDVAEAANASVGQVYGVLYRGGSATPALQAAVQVWEAPANQTVSQQMSRRKPVRIPKAVDSGVAAFLGYLIGDGHISRVKRNLGLTTGDEPQARAFAELAYELFDLLCVMKWDEGRWRVLIHSETLADFLCEGLGLTSGPSAREKQIPAVILRSPKPVVAAFLRAYFDCDAHAGKKPGVILSTMSDKLAEQTQLLLLNFGILSRRRRQKDGCWQLCVCGQSAAVFAREIGFGLARKQKALEEHVANRRWFKKERWVDEIVSIERGRADVYDISVEETHRYAAQGFVNHNSFWHSTIMTQKALKDSEIIDYADHHSGTMGTRPGAINPYKLGIELWRHIEERWNKGRFGKEYDDCDDLRARRAWDKKLGLGREKIFEVRKHYNDITFIDEFLTADFAAEQKLFVYGFNEKGNRWEILDREFQKVKKKLLQQLTNFGQPIIEVADGNFENRGELLLAHRHDGVDLRVDYAKDTLANLQAMWRRPVALVTRVDGKGMLMRFDGRDHTDRKVEY